MSAHEPTPDLAQERPPVEEVIEELRHNAAQADPFLEMTLDDGVAWLTDLRARVRELEAALRQSRRVVEVYEGLRTDANDGTFALWSEDDLVRELHALGTALAAAGGAEGDTQ